MHVAFDEAREEAAGGAATGAAAPVESQPGVSDELDELLLEEVAAELPEDRAEHAAPDSYEAPPQSPGEVAAAEAAIRGASDRDAVARLTLRLARRFARVVALLVVNRGVIAGIRAEGEGLEQRIEGVMISASVEGLFARVVADASPHRIIAPFDGMDLRVLGALGRRDVQDVCVFPVVIRGRVVNLLYVDNGPDGLPETSVAAFGAVCNQVALAYERLILEKKGAPANR
jgi:hypothetical protein